MTLVKKEDALCDRHPNLVNGGIVMTRRHYLVFWRLRVEGVAVEWYGWRCLFCARCWSYDLNREWIAGGMLMRTRLP